MSLVNQIATYISQSKGTLKALELIDWIEKKSKEADFFMTIEGKQYPVHNVKVTFDNHLDEPLDYKEIIIEYKVNDGCVKKVQRIPKSPYDFLVFDHRSIPMYRGPIR